MNYAIDIVAETVCCLLFFTGMLILYRRNIIIFINKIKMRRRLKERRRVMDSLSPLENHFDVMTKTVMNFKGRYLMAAMMLIFITVFTIGSRSLTILNTLILALSMASAPYMIFRIKFEGIRRKSSFEGEMLISNFLNQYRIANFNIYEALEKLVSESRNTKITNRLILKMLLELQSTGNPKEIKKAVRKFSDIVNTNWSRMLGYNLQLAAEKGINVSLAVEDILIQLRDARVLYEERKRLNSEAARIVVYMIPFLYGFTVIMSLKFIGLSLGEYIKNQLFTKEGFMFLAVSGVMFLMNIALVEIVSKQKFDY